MSNDHKAYLGDAVYAKFDGYHIVLSTPSAGQIYLDPQVLAALIAYAERIKKEAGK